MAILFAVNAPIAYAASKTEREDQKMNSPWTIGPGESAGSEDGYGGGGSGGGGGGGGGACQAVGPNPTGIPKDLNLGTDAKERRMNLMGLLMADYNLTAAQAAGIIGNFMIESMPDIKASLNQGDSVNKPPTANYAKGNAFGFAQWDGSRKRDFVNFAVEAGYVSSLSVIFNDAANYAFLAKELGGSEAKALPALQQQETPRDAAVSWRKVFERSVGTAQDIKVRGDSAQQVYDEFLALNPDGEADPTGCVSDIVAGKPDIDTSRKDAFDGPLIENPTGVVLHWTAGDPNADVDDFISAIQSNTACEGGCTVQFYVKGDGTIYQLVDPINTKTAHAAGANSCCIGIEIGGRGADDLLKNEDQKQAVVNLVAFLVEKFRMQTDTDVPGLKGILSHHILPQGIQRGKTDVGDAYLEQILTAVNKSKDDESDPET